MRILLNITRIIVGVLFIFSGLVKANDPLGLSYKMQEFFEVWGWSFLDNYTLTFSVAMIAFEIIAGVAVLVGWQTEKVDGNVTQHPKKARERAPVLCANPFDEPNHCPGNKDKERAGQDRRQVVAQSIREGLGKPKHPIFRPLGVDRVRHCIAREGEVEKHIGKDQRAKTNHCLPDRLAAPVPGFLR